MAEDALTRLLDANLDAVPVDLHPSYVTQPVGSVGDVRRAVLDTLRPLIRTYLAADPGLLVISMGRCRVGSTALTNLFGMAGVPSFFQPFKAVMRQHLHGMKDTAHIAAMAQPGVVHAKEMLGPYTLAETMWSPFIDLLEMGFPADRLAIVWLERDPLASLASWLHHWGGVLPRETLVQNFILATRCAAKTARDMAAAGVRVVPFNYDSIRDNPAAVLAVLDALGVTHDMHRDDLAWGQRGNLASAASAITFVPEPAAYGAVKVHSNLPEYKHVARATDAVTEADRELLAAHGLFDIHAGHLRRCVAGQQSGANTTEQV